ncbi:DUF1214 domain-containing protein [Halopseudomonas salegens]|uniref:DUF1214 domain-containing protein n=1 Tax=Halopseudomonas salegens TaxID=1434072 RepID=A0A1H2GUN6_9GAMM|nr:DUF1214 domain-containing protein [Halopseudomonas salegens]SDU23360.1 hypothetical protein SAMN05216210_2564 [Halopseudomonas salegens]
MKLIGKLAAAFLVALVLGIGSAWVVINAMSPIAGRGGMIQNGAWTTSLLIGSSAATPYTRAIVARAGLLALAKSETVYFTAFTDDDGAPLKTDCTYAVSGTPLPARWWSITAYGANHYLIPNGHDKYSENKHSLSWQGVGEGRRFRFALGPDAQEGDFIPTGHDSGEGAPFSLTLRLYNPEPQVIETPGAIDLPILTKERCR